MDNKYLIEFISDYPKLIFDGKFVDLPYKDFSEVSIRETMFKEHLALFSSVNWIINVLSDMNEDEIKVEKTKILLAKLNLEYIVDKTV